MYVLRAIFYLLLIIFLLPVQLQTSDLKSPIPDEQQIDETDPNSFVQKSADFSTEKKAVDIDDIYDEALLPLPEFDVHDLSSGRLIGRTQLPIVTPNGELWSTPTKNEERENDDLEKFLHLYKTTTTPSAKESTESSTTENSFSPIETLPATSTQLTTTPTTPTPTTTTTTTTTPTTTVTTSSTISTFNKIPPTLVNAIPIPPQTNLTPTIMKITPSISQILTQTTTPSTTLFQTHTITSMQNAMMPSALPPSASPPASAGAWSWTQNWSIDANGRLTVNTWDSKNGQRIETRNLSPVERTAWLASHPTHTVNNKASVPRFNQRRSLVPSDSDSDLEPEPESESQTQTQPQPQPQLQQLEPALLQNVEQVDTEEDATVFDSMDQKSLQAKVECRVLDASVDGIPSRDTDPSCELSFLGIPMEGSNCSCTYRPSGIDADGCAIGYIFTCTRRTA